MVLPWMAIEITEYDFIQMDGKDVEWVSQENQGDFKWWNQSLMDMRNEYW